MVNISDFLHIVKIEIPSKSANTSGGQNEGFTDLVTTRGYMRKLDGFRAFDEGYDKLVNRYELLIYWRKEIETNMTKDMRFVYDNRFFKLETWEYIDEQRGFYKFKLAEAS